MTPQQLQEILNELGLTPQRMHSIRSLPTFEEVSQALEDLKAEVRKRYKRLVFRYHPDRNPGDPLAGERIKVLGKVLADLEGLRIARAPQRVVTTVVFVHPGVGTPWSNRTTATAAPKNYDAHRVVFIRP